MKENTTALAVKIDQRLSSILICGAVDDKYNSNVIIRHCVAEGFRLAYPEAQVHECSLFLASDMTEMHKPELVLAVGGLVIDSADLWCLRRACDRVDAKLAFWLHDDPYEFDYSFKVKGLADIVFTNDQWAMEHYEHDNVYHLPLATSKSIYYRPIKTTRLLDAFFCGVGYPNRVNFFRGFTSIAQLYKVHVFGQHWPVDIPFATNRRIDSKKFADMAASSKFTFNIGRDFDLANRRLELVPSTPGPRTFDVALAGSAQLYFVDSLEIMDYFEPNKEILLFDSGMDVCEAFERALDQPEWVINIAVAAQERALQEHCYQHRANSIVNAMYG